MHLGDASVRPAVITKVMRFQRIQYCLEVNTPRRAYIVRLGSRHVLAAGLAADHVGAVLLRAHSCAPFQRKV